APAAESFAATYPTRDMNLWQQLGDKGAAFGQGELEVDLATTRGDDVAHIVDLKPVIYSRSLVSPVWRTAVGSGCGDAYERSFPSTCRTAPSSTTASAADRAVPQRPRHQATPSARRSQSPHTTPPR